MGRRGAFAVAALTLSVGMLGTTLPTPLYSLYSQKFGFSVLIVTVIFATYAAGVISSLLLFGRLSDQIGRRPVLLGALTVAGIGAGCFLVADGLPMLLIGRAIAGLAAGIFTGAGTATLTDLAAPGQRARATLIATVANMGGLGMGPLLAGVLARWAGSPLRLVFWVYLGLVVAAAIGVLTMPEPLQTKRHAQLRPQRLHVPRDMRDLFSHAAIAAFAGFAVLGLFSAVSPSLLGQVLGVTSPAAVGLVVFLVFAASAIGQAVLLPIVGQDRALPAGCVALIAGMGLLAASIGFSSLALLVLAGLVAGLGHGLSFRAGLAGLNEKAPAGLRAEIDSSYFVVAYVGIALPAIGDGVLTQLVGLRTAGFVFAAVVAVIATVGLVLLARALSRVDVPRVNEPRSVLYPGGSHA
jgi:MFS family permease